MMVFRLPPATHSTSHSPHSTLHSAAICTPIQHPASSTGWAAGSGQKTMQQQQQHLRDIDYFHLVESVVARLLSYWLDAISICLAPGVDKSVGIPTEVARTDVFHRQATHSVSGSEGEAS
jgi:hypothetical protein